MSPLAEALLVAGPNGAGKTSFALKFLPTQHVSYTYINADEVARRLRSQNVPAAHADLQAGREVVARARQSVELGENMMIETTLSGTSWSRQIPDWRARGYLVVIYYLRLPDAETAIARVRRRVQAGGHDIPAATIRRRFDRSLELLDRVYRPIVDECHIFDI